MRPSGGGPSGRRTSGREKRTKDRSALRRFSPLVVKRGYKTQRDGLGESCTRCARLLTSSSCSSSSSSFCSLPFSTSARGMARLFSMRQFNDAMRPRLFAVAGEKKRVRGGKLAGIRARAGSCAHGFRTLVQIYRAFGRISVTTRGN